MCCRNKGRWEQSNEREQWVQAATHDMFFAGAEVTRFLRVTSTAVALANRRHEANLRHVPQLEEDVPGLLTELIKYYD